jgi:zinc protease
MYVGHFLTGGFIPSIGERHRLVQELVPGITADELNRLAAGLMTTDNRVVLADAPEKAGVAVPDETALRRVFDAVAQADIQPYADDFASRPLIEYPPAPGTVTAERSVPVLGITEWTLSNGIRVVLKPTDFKNDEVQFAAHSPGGYSLARSPVPALTAAGIVDQAGVDGFTLLDLEKLLAGRIVSVSPWIDEFQEGFSGGASPQDIESMFQLIHLYAVSPRKDSTAFNSYRERLRGYIENRSADPETAFGDTIQVTLAGYSPWARPWTPALLDELHLGESFDVYRDRFADMGDFTFFFVGNFEPKALRPLVETYLGSLPSAGRQETWRDLGIKPPRGVIEKEVRRGTEDVGRVEIVFTGPFEWNRLNRYTIQTMADVFEIRLREVLRENLGGTYSVRVDAGVQHYPRPEYRLVVGFGCDPGRVEELTDRVIEEIGALRANGPDAAGLDKVREMQRRQQEVSLRENGYWLTSLSFYDLHGEDPRQILELNRYIDAVTVSGLRDAANRYFDLANRMTFQLFPESATE